MNNLATVWRMDRRAASVPADTSGVWGRIWTKGGGGLSELDASGDGEPAEAERITADGSFSLALLML